MAKETDKKTLDLIKKTLDLIKEVKARKAEISKAEKPNWITNCTFSQIEGSASNVINLHVETNVKTLIGVAAYLMSAEKSYKEAAAALKVDSPPEFTWNGFSVKDWIEDIKARIGKIQITSKKKGLETLESRLNAIISPELRAEMGLDAIASELGG